MNRSAPYLQPSEAARQLGISTKALRLYEERGLISPTRTEAGWRVYGADTMARSAEIAALRRLGLSLAQVARVLDGKAADLAAALTAHAAALERQAQDLAGKIRNVRRLQSDLASGGTSCSRELRSVLEPDPSPSVTFDLPWPWGGERYELSDIRPIMYITGPLGSGKTRLARRLAQVLPEAAFLGMERLDDGRATDARPSANDRGDDARIEAALTWIADEGGWATDALRKLLSAIETGRQGSLIVDMIEQDLDAATQAAVMAYLRHRAPPSQPLFVLTRSTAILDLDLVGRHEGIIYCPANHSPPLRVAPFEGAAGYEAVATCLAAPDVRARTEGVIAWRPKAV
ncbi:MAG: MerR family transcriptional regulator [Hyphomicrobiaceae bacterium]